MVTLIGVVCLAFAFALYVSGLGAGPSVATLHRALVIAGGVLLLVGGTWSAFDPVPNAPSFVAALR